MPIDTDPPLRYPVLVTFQIPDADLDSFLEVCKYTFGKIEHGYVPLYKNDEKLRVIENLIPKPFRETNVAFMRIPIPRSQPATSYNHLASKE